MTAVVVRYETSSTTPMYDYQEKATSKIWTANEANEIRVQSNR